MEDSTWREDLAREAAKNGTKPTPNDHACI